MLELQTRLVEPSPVAAESSPKRTGGSEPRLFHATRQRNGLDSLDLLPETLAAHLLRGVAFTLTCRLAFMVCIPMLGTNPASRVFYLTFTPWHDTYLNQVPYFVYWSNGAHWPSCGTLDPSE